MKTCGIRNQRPEDVRRNPKSYSPTQNFAPFSPWRTNRMPYLPAPQKRLSQRLMQVFRFSVAIVFCPGQAYFENMKRRNSAGRAGIYLK